MGTLRKRWTGLSPKKRKRIVYILFSLFVVSFLVGWYIGRAFSPDYNSEFAAAQYISANFRVQNGKSFDPILTVQAGPRRCEYVFSRDAVHCDLPPPEILAAMPLPHRNALEENDRLIALSGILAAPATAAGMWGQLYKVGNTVTAPERTALLLAGAATCLTGGGLGAYVGYHDERNWEAPNFLKGIQSKENWKPVAQGIVTCERKIGEGEASIRALDIVLSGPHEYDSKAVKLQTEAREQIEQIKKSNNQCREFLAWAYDRH